MELKADVKSVITEFQDPGHRYKLDGYQRHFKMTFSVKPIKDSNRIKAKKKRK